MYVVGLQVFCRVGSSVQGVVLGSVLLLDATLVGRSELRLLLARQNGHGKLQHDLIVVVATKI